MIIRLGFTTKLRVALFLAMSASMIGRAQDKMSIHGFVKDEQTGEVLPGATVYLPIEKTGTSSNSYGFYSIPSDKDTVYISVSYVGYETYTDTLALKNSVQIDIYLKPSKILLESVVITGGKDSNAQIPDLGVTRINSITFNKTPSLFGESDVFKTLQLLPGTTGGAEGSGGVFVRGGTPDQNLVILDGVPVYNVNHLFGFLSQFNPDAIKHVDFYKSKLPPKYGGRLSSVIDMKMKEGNMKKKDFSLNMSPITSRFTYEAPIKKNKSSFMIAGRRTWLDLIFRLMSQEVNHYNFYDLNAKVNKVINQKNRLYFAAYVGKDKFKTKQDDFGESNSYGFGWGNTNFSVRWDRLISEKLFMNVTSYYSNYKFGINFLSKSEEERFEYIQESNVSDLTTKAYFDYYPSEKHTISFGGDFTHFDYKPEQITIKSNDIDTLEISQNTVNNQYAAHVNYNYQPSDKIDVDVGFRGVYIKALNYDFSKIEPRISITAKLGDKLHLFGTYNQMYQFIHLLAQTSVSFPVDFWVPSNESVNPENSKQLTTGLKYSASRIGVHFTAEVFYKSMENLIEYKDGVAYLTNNDAWTDQVASGSGVSNGVELYVEKNKGVVTGWVSYTLSETNRKFDDINNGEPFPFKYDHRHNISVLSEYNISKNKKFGLVFNLLSGGTATFTTGKYPISSGLPFDFDSQFVEHYENRNNLRLEDFHHLDISYTTSKMKKKFMRSWIFSIYNVYNRKNTFILYQNKGKIQKISLFPFIPSVTYRIEL